MGGTTCRRCGRPMRQGLFCPHCRLLLTERAGVSAKITLAVIALAALSLWAVSCLG